jgi:hypothetical protein
MREQATVTNNGAYCGVVLSAYTGTRLGSERRWWYFVGVKKRGSGSFRRGVVFRLAAFHISIYTAEEDLDGA